MNHALMKIRCRVAPARRVCTALLLALAGSACGGSGDSGDSPPADGNVGSAEPATTGDAAVSAAAPDAGHASGNGGSAQQPDSSAPVESDYDVAKKLVGSYAARISYRDIVSAGIAGMGSLVTTVLATAEITDDPAAKVVKLSANLCESHIAAPNKHIADLVVDIPEAALTAAHLDPAPIQVTKAGSTTSWKTDELHGTAGWKWSSPSDSLPVFDDDPSLVDQDGDGLPGVSATFNGHAMGTLYLALVYRFLFSGTVAANGDLTGTTTSMSKEGLLGSDEVLLLGTTIDRSTDPETGDNTVELLRQASAMNCDQLKAQKDTLFH